MNLTLCLTITHDLSVVTSSCGKIVVLYAGQIMEFGAVRSGRADVSALAEGLIRSFPSLYGEKRALRGIPGTLPDLYQPAAGVRVRAALPTVPATAASANGQTLPSTRRGTLPPAIAARKGRRNSHGKETGFQPSFSTEKSTCWRFGN